MVKVGSFADSPNFKNVPKGTVYAENENTIFIENFNFESTKDKEAFFWAGEFNFTLEAAKNLTEQVNNTVFLHPNGTSDFFDYTSYEADISDEIKTNFSLATYAEQNITLALPMNMKVSNLKFLSVWSPMSDTKDRGHVSFPEDLDIPEAPVTSPVTGSSEKVLYSSGTLFIALLFGKLI